MKSDKEDLQELSGIIRDMGRQWIAVNRGELKRNVRNRRLHISNLLYSIKGER